MLRIAYSLCHPPKSLLSNVFTHSGEANFKGFDVSPPAYTFIFVVLHKKPLCRTSSESLPDTPLERAFVCYTRRELHSEIAIKTTTEADGT